MIRVMERGLSLAQTGKNGRSAPTVKVPGLGCGRSGSAMEPGLLVVIAVIIEVATGRSSVVRSVDLSPRDVIDVVNAMVGGVFMTRAAR